MEGVLFREMLLSSVIAAGRRGKACCIGNPGAGGNPSAGGDPI